MNNRNTLITLAVIILLVLAGCGEKKTCPSDCSDGDTCTADSCGKDTGYECSHSPIPGCSSACGMPCTGAAGLYTEMKCDPATKQCASDAKTGLKISTSSITNEMQSVGNKFNVISTFNQPFNMKKDLFNVKVSLRQIAPGMSNIKLKSIEITGLDKNRQTVTLGQKTINKYLWSTETSAEEGVQVNFATSEPDGSFSNIKLRFSYDYQQEYSGQVQSKSGVFEITMQGVTFTWLNPGMTSVCPASCDDNNAGTSDICNAGTGYFCTHQSIPGRCGNFICDPTENKCTCETDCGPCSGDAGQYLEFTCQANECKTMTKPGVMQQPVSKLDEKNRNFYYLQNTYTYIDPFNVNTDKFQLEFKLYNKQDAVGGIKIIEAKLLDQTTEVASVDIGQNINAIGGTVTADLPITSFALHESSKSFNLRVDIEYQYTTVTGTELRKDNFITSLGKITLINPTLS